MKNVSLAFWKPLAPLCDLSKSYCRISVNEYDLSVNQLCKTALKSELSVWDVYPGPHDNCLLKDLMWFRERAELLEESMNFKIRSTKNSPREIWAVDYSWHDSPVLFIFLSCLCTSLLPLCRFSPFSTLIHFSSVCLSVNLSESWWRALLKRDQMFLQPNLHTGA